MAGFLGRFRLTVLDTAGAPVSGASVYVRKQGATVNGSQSGTTPLVVTVNHQGGIRASENVSVNNGTTTYFVSAVTETTITLSGFAGTLSLNDDDRMVAATNPPGQYNDAVAAESLAHPLTSDSLGEAVGWMIPGFYDVLVTGASITNRLIQDHYVAGGGRMELKVNEAPYHAKFDNSTDDWRAITNALLDAEAINISGGGVGAVVVMPRGTALVSAPVVIPSRVILRGQGVDATALKPSGSFTFNGTTDAVVRIGEAADDSVFDSRVEQCEIDCNDVANSIGVYSHNANEGAGIRGVQVQRPILKGIFFDTGYCQNWAMEDVGVAMAGTANPASAIGIDIGSAVAGSNTISRFSVGAYSGSSVVMLAAIRANGSTSNFSALIQNGHVEECTTGVKCSTHNILVQNVSGLAGVTSVVGIDAAVGNIVAIAISKHGATNSVADTARSETITGDCAFYASGLSSETAYFGLNASVDSQIAGTVKVRSSLRFRDRVDVASAATIYADTNPGNYWHITGTTTITAIGDATTNNGRVIVMEFQSAACQVTDNGTTLDLIGNYTSSVGGVLTLISDGTNWHEVARSGGHTGTSQAYSPPGASATLTLTDATVEIVLYTSPGFSNSIATINPSTQAGRRLAVRANGAAGDTANILDGSNLKLNGNFSVGVSPAVGSLDLICDGTNWIELSRIISGLN